MTDKLNIRVLAVVLFTIYGFFSPLAMAQSLCEPHSKLFCLVPNQLGVPSDQFKALNEAIGIVVSDLPLASPASGVIFTIDPKLNLPVPGNETLGPILTQRPETAGKHRLYFAAVYQFFRFEDLDGISLKHIPVVTITPNLGFDTNNRLDLTVNQVTGYFTFGLTARVDVSVAVPILEIQEQFISTGTKYVVNSPTSNPTSPISVKNTGSASGIGDVVFAAKGIIWKPTHGGLAAGIEVRVPTGDALDFLGAGTTGVKPYAAIAYGLTKASEGRLAAIRRVSVHANLGYQINGNSKLAASATGVAGHLSNRLFYSEGVDWGATKWATFVVDVLSERVFNSSGIALGSSVINTDRFPTIVATTNSYNRSDGSAGLKLRPYRNLLITGNVLVKLDQGGLRSRIVPLAGLSYTF